MDVDAVVMQPATRAGEESGQVGAFSADYAEDFYAWTQHQVALLRDGDWAAVDVANLIEEIETMGRSERRELTNRLEQLLLHLLKWQYQRVRRGRSWLASIRYQRVGIARLLADNPSLRPLLPAILADVYVAAVLRAEIETNLAAAVFPERCPYTVEQILDMAWLPADEPNL